MVVAKVWGITTLRECLGLVRSVKGGNVKGEAPPFTFHAPQSRRRNSKEQEKQQQAID